MRGSEPAPLKDGMGLLDWLTRYMIPWGRWLMLATAAVAGTIPRLAYQPSWLPQWLHTTIIEYQFWLVAFPAAAVVPLEWIQICMVRRRRATRLTTLLQRFLERIRPEFFSSELRDAPPPYHRLTLFKANKRQTRLKIMARSGEATSGSKTCWRIHRDEESRCEGIAGVGWFLSVVMTVPARGHPALPDVSGNPAEEAVADYAARTYVTCEQVRRHRWRARSFTTIPIRDGGHRWGVLVLDSIDPSAAQHQNVKRMTLFTPDLLRDIIKGWSDP